MKNHFLVLIVWLCLGLPAAAGYAQEQPRSEPNKSKGLLKLDNAVEEKPMPVRSNVGTAASVPAEAGKGGQADSLRPRLVFNPKRQQKPEK